MSEGVDKSANQDRDMALAIVGNHYHTAQSFGIDPLKWLGPAENIAQAPSGEWAVYAGTSAFDKIKDIVKVKNAGRVKAGQYVPPLPNPDFPALTSSDNPDNPYTRIRITWTDAANSADLNIILELKADSDPDFNVITGPGQLIASPGAARSFDFTNLQHNTHYVIRARYYRLESQLHSTAAFGTHTTRTIPSIPSGQGAVSITNNPLSYGGASGKTSVSFQWTDDFNAVQQGMRWIVTLRDPANSIVHTSPETAASNSSAYTIGNLNSQTKYKITIYYVDYDPILGRRVGAEGPAAPAPDGFTTGVWVPPPIVIPTPVFQVTGSYEAGELYFNFENKPSGYRVVLELQQYGSPTWQQVRFDGNFVWVSQYDVSNTNNRVTGLNQGKTYLARAYYVNATYSGGTAPGANVSNVSGAYNDTSDYSRYARFPSLAKPSPPSVTATDTRSVSLSWSNTVEATVSVVFAWDSGSLVNAQTSTLTVTPTTAPDAETLAQQSYKQGMWNYGANATSAVLNYLLPDRLYYFALIFWVQNKYTGQWGVTDVGYAASTTTKMDGWIGWGPYTKNDPITLPSAPANNRALFEDDSSSFYDPTGISFAGNWEIARGMHARMGNTQVEMYVPIEQTRYFFKVTWDKPFGATWWGMAPGSRGYNLVQAQANHFNLGATHFKLIAMSGDNNTTFVQRYWGTN